MIADPELEILSEGGYLRMITNILSGTERYGRTILLGERLVNMRGGARVVFELRRALDIFLRATGNPRPRIAKPLLVS